MKNKYIKIGVVLIFSFLLLGAVATTLDDFFLPGSQPGQSGSFDSPNQCGNCHGGYDETVEPKFNWDGSMMAQAMRDPLYIASLVIANQDAHDAGDLCLRCHTPGGWLEGRSVPTDGSALNDVDMEGVQCHFCHKLIDPLSTSPLDLAYINTLSDVPPQSGNGMFVVDSENSAKRGPYDDAEANHPTIYSPFHSESDLCGTCHDVSNPAFSKAPDGTYQPNEFGAPSPSFDTYEMFPVERTYSEWKMSAYNTPQGIPSDVFGGNKLNVSTCQDCHMKDVTGYGCDKPWAPLRNDLPLHDMTGGNTFVPLLVGQLFPDVDQEALAAGIERAEGMLMSAATMNLTVAPNNDEYTATVEIINETGHKLPSGYPEGRRMWINITAYDIDDIVVFESGAYDPITAILDMGGAKIYEAKLGMSQAVADAASADGIYTYTAGESFHFVLNNMVIKDNRIPPRGFTNVNFEAIQSPPVGYTYADGAHSDNTNYTLPSSTFRVNAKLLYQTTSKEYVEFLRDKNVTDNSGQVLYDLWAANGKSTPVIMNETDFFTEPLDVADVDLSDYSIQIYPNPADELVSINFNLKLTSNVLLEVFNVAGQYIETVYDDILNPGGQIVTWQSAHLSTGTYIMRFKFPKRTESRLIIIK